MCFTVSVKKRWLHRKLEFKPVYIVKRTSLTMGTLTADCQNTNRRILAMVLIRPKRHTQKTGDISEQAAITRLLQCGYVILQPIGQMHRYDLNASTLNLRNNRSGPHPLTWLQAAVSSANSATFHWKHLASHRRGCRSSAGVHPDQNFVRRWGSCRSKQVIVLFSIGRKLVATHSAKTLITPKRRFNLPYIWRLGITRCMLHLYPR